MKAKVEGGEILFTDQVSIRSDQVTGRTWGEKGRTPVVRRSANRFSVNTMSAISTRRRMHFLVITESLTAEVMCRFLDRLPGHFDHKVHLVVDGHSAHRSGKVRDWLATHPDEVELHFLPPYATELNPDELVNAHLEHSLPRQHQARNQTEIAAETRRFLHRRQRQPPHRPRLLRRPTRPLRPRHEPHEFLINRRCRQSAALTSGARVTAAGRTGPCLLRSRHG